MKEIISGGNPQWPSDTTEEGSDLEQRGSTARSARLTPDIPARTLLPKLLSGFIIMLLSAVFSCIGFGGCAYVSHNPINELPDRSVSIPSDHLNSERVQNRLGSPLIASRSWGVEVFRDERSQIEIPVAIIVPVGRIEDHIYRYTLVSYDKDRIATSTASAIHRRPSAFRIASPIEYNNLSLHLKAGDFTFVILWEDRHETLLVSPARRNAYLEQARSSSHCTAVIGCGTGECSNKLQVDEGPTLPLPCRLRVQNFDENALSLLRQGRQEDYDRVYPTKTYDTVAALSLAPGSHTLKSWGGRWERGKLAGLFSGEQSITFSCLAGEILYIEIDVSAKDYSWWGARDIAWRIDLHKEMPTFFADRHLVIYRGDQWFANSEPGN